MAGWFAGDDKDKLAKLVEEAQKMKPRMGPVPQGITRSDLEGLKLLVWIIPRLHVYCCIAVKSRLWWMEFLSFRLSAI